MIMLVHPMKIEFARKLNKWFLLSMKIFKESPLIVANVKLSCNFNISVPEGGNDEKEWQVYLIYMP